MSFIVAPGATSISVDVFFADDTGAAVTGKAAADFPACKWSSGTNTADTTITLSDLAAITTAHPNDNTAGGVKEREGGWYRLDLPNNMFTNAGRRTLTFVEAANKRIIAPQIDVQLPSVALANTAHGGAAATLELGSATATSPFYIHSSNGSPVRVDGTGLNPTIKLSASGGSDIFNLTGSTGDCFNLSTGGDVFHFTSTGTGYVFNVQGLSDKELIHLEQANPNLDAITVVVGGTGAGFRGSIVGNITGNLSGSVGSVTGNVGGNVVGSVASVTGAVGSVTGNIGGNVAGSVGSVTGNVGGNVVGSVASVTGAVGSVTGNVGGNVAGSVGSIAADGIAAASVSTAAAQKLAAVFFRRTMANVEGDSNGDALDLSSLYGLIQQAQESSMSGATLTIKKTDGTTTLGTKTVATDATADPVTGVS